MTLQHGDKIRAVLVEDDLLFRDLLRIGLTQTGQVDVIGTYADGEVALVAASDLGPHVALLDIELRGGLNGIQLGRLLRQRLPNLGIVLLSHHRIPAFLSAVPPAEMAGWSYLLKSSVQELSVLLRAVEGVAAGEVVLDSELIGALPGTPQGRLAQLTARQLEILRLMAMGFANQAIAEQLMLARKTVENQINELYRELALDPSDTKVQARVQAVLIYLQENRLL